MKKYLVLSVLGLSLFAAACEDPSANKTKATVNEPSANSSANSGNSNVSNTSVSSIPETEPALKGTGYKITPENSKVEFTGSKVTGKHDGGFKEFTGTIDSVNSKAVESSVWVSIDTASTFSDSDGLTEHLKSADFFDVAKFPKAIFKSTKIEADTANGADAYTVTGDFNFHGVTKSISFPATIKLGADNVAVNAEFTLNRKDFGIVYAGKADDLIRDGVVIKLDLKADKK